MSLISAIGLGVAIGAALALLPEALKGAIHHRKIMKPGGKH